MSAARESASVAGETTAAVRAALSHAGRRSPALVAATLASAAATTSGFATYWAANELTFDAVSAGHWIRETVGAFRVIGLFVAFVGWITGVATLQRAWIIALDEATTATAALGVVWSRLARLVVIVIARTTFVVVVVLGSVVTLFRPADADGPWTISAAVFTFWWLMHALTGVAVANVVTSGDRPVAALTRSARDLSGFRLAGLICRVPFAAAAAAAVTLLGTAGAPTAYAVATFVIGSIVTTLDAVLELIWHRRVRSPVERENLAAVFE